MQGEQGQDEQPGDPGFAVGVAVRRASGWSSWSRAAVRSSYQSVATRGDDQDDAGRRAGTGAALP